MVRTLEHFHKYLYGPWITLQQIIHLHIPWFRLTKKVGSSSSTSHLYSDGVKLESWPGHQL
jgi:hypothetical protein